MKPESAEIVYQDGMSIRFYVTDVDSLRELLDEQQQLTGPSIVSVEWPVDDA